MNDDDMRIVTNNISRAEIQELANQRFGDMTKAVVDLERRVMAVGGEMHADLEALLLEQGSKQMNLWGINLYPRIIDDSWIEFDSMINIRPTQGNRSRGVEDEATRKRIVELVRALV